MSRSSGDSVSIIPGMVKPWELVSVLAGMAVSSSRSASTCFSCFQGCRLGDRKRLIDRRDIAKTQVGKQSAEVVVQRRRLVARVVRARIAAVNADVRIMKHPCLEESWRRIRFSDLKATVSMPNVRFGANR